MCLKSWNLLVCKALQLLLSCCGACPLSATAVHVFSASELNISIKGAIVKGKTNGLAVKKIYINPFTTPASEISGLKDARTCLKKQYIFWAYNTSTFSAMRFNNNNNGNL